MRMKPTSLTLIAAIFFLAFFATFLSPHAASAQEACQYQGDPNADSGSSGLGNGPSPVVMPPGTNGLNGALGGYDPTGNTPNGAFYNNYTNASTNVVMGRQQTKHAFMQNVQSIDAKLHYCFNLLRNVFLIINTNGGIWQAILAMIINQLIIAIVTALCVFMQQLVQDVKSLISMAANFLCLPIPKLRMPRFIFPFTGKKCSGMNLLNLAGISIGVGNKNSAVYWNIWNRQQQQ